MGSFDVLDPHLNLFQNRFLEASAGTGKTFAIENIVVRLLQEGIDLERILIVTFTKAATADLKMRIRKNIFKAKLFEQLHKFDEARIFTMHSFCFHSLREHALEADLSLEQEEEMNEENVRKIVKDYLRNLDDYSPKQLEKMVRRGIDPLVDSILRYALDRIPIETGPSYSQVCAQIKALGGNCEQIFEQAPFFGKMCNRQKELKPEIRKGLEEFYACMHGEDVDIVDSPILHMQRENLLKRAPEMDFSFLEKAIPLVQEVSDELKILARLCEGARKKIEESGELFFEDLLIRMDQKVKEPNFAEQIRKQYDVCLIDEFQDTNPIQWRIFKTLFLNKILYLVGDPKQAIYRFRHADIYTYMAAKKEFDCVDVLDTNYRSTPPVVQALNAIFSHVNIALPKTGETLSIYPVKWDSSKNAEGGVFHLQAESEEDLFAAILQRVEKPLSGNAILVKDRYQAERFIAFATQAGFPAVSRRARSLLDSPAKPLLRALLFAVQNPHDHEAVLRVLGGPLYGDVSDENPFFDYQRLLEEKGLFSFFRQWIEDHGATEAYPDMLQLVEYLAEEQISIEELIPYLDQMRGDFPARQNSAADALQVLTIHVSKGLEFDTVFPVGLVLPATRKRELVCVDERYLLSEEAQKLHHAELEAEEMRQLYVAFTRAKRRLYILSLKEGRGPINRIPLDLEVEDVTGSSLPPPPLVEKPRWQKPLAREKQWRPLLVHSFSSLYPHEPSGASVEKGLPAGAAASSGVKVEQGLPAGADEPAGAKVEQGLLAGADEPSGASVEQGLPVGADEPSGASVEQGLPSGAAASSGTKAEGGLPAGAEVGTWIHMLLEKLDFPHYKRDLPALIESTPLLAHKDELYSMIEAALTTPLPKIGVPLVEIKRMVKEMEFLYTVDSGYMKGFIDLFFEHEGVYYLLDWKSNVEVEMEKTHYFEQARIYREAMQRYVEPFGGSFYYFLRHNRVIYD